MKPFLCFPPYDPLVLRLIFLWYPYVCFIEPTPSPEPQYKTFPLVPLFMVFWDSRTVLEFSMHFLSGR